MLTDERLPLAGGPGKNLIFDEGISEGGDKPGVARKKEIRLETQFTSQGRFDFSDVGPIPGEECALQESLHTTEQSDPAYDDDPE